MSIMRCSLAVAFSLTLFTITVRADDWPQWAGPRRDGVWRETGLLEKFPPGGPKVLWRVPVGGGYSGPAVVGERVYVMDRPGVAPPPPGQEAAIPRDAIPGTERVLCLDAATGQTVWEHSYDCPYQLSYPAGPRTTPIVDGDKLYTLGAMGDLRCLDAATGQLIWARQFRKDFEVKPPVWGWSSTPVIDGDRLFSLVGGDGTTVVAFDKHTGKELWRALSTREIGYAPPLMIDAGGQRQLLIWHSEEVAGLDPATGKVYWSVEYPVQGERRPPEVNIAAPRLAGNRLLLTSFYHGSQMLELAQDKPAAKLLWNQEGKNLNKPDRGLHTVMGTPIIKDGHIYGVCGFGELRCLKADTGERVWETYAATGGQRGMFANAFLVEQGERVWIYNDQGDLIVAKLSPQGYEEIDRVHLLDTTLATRGREVTWCHPAFANRCCYVRNDKEMVCVSLAAG